MNEGVLSSFYCGLASHEKCFEASNKNSTFYLKLLLPNLGIFSRNENVKANFHDVFWDEFANKSIWDVDNIIQCCRLVFYNKTQSDKKRQNSIRLQATAWKARKIQSSLCTLISSSTAYYRLKLQPRPPHNESAQFCTSFVWTFTCIVQRYWFFSPLINFPSIESIAWSGVARRKKRFFNEQSLKINRFDESNETRKKKPQKFLFTARDCVFSDVFRLLFAAERGDKIIQLTFQ